jgi:L-iduronidase
MAAAAAAALLLLLLLPDTSSAQPLRLAVDTAAGAHQPFPHIWEATGWCPPDMEGSALAMHNYSMQEASWQNHALIRAVPNQGLRLVRIHSMLNLVTLNAGHAVAHPLPPSAYNWTLLDALLDMVAGEHQLRLGFEIMGNPRLNSSARTGVYTSWGAPEQLEGWRSMVQALAQRYMQRFGADAVSQWRWETWNEPDHGCSHKKQMNAGIDCDQESWLGYWDACAEGLRTAGASHGARLTFGGERS